MLEVLPGQVRSLQTGRLEALSGRLRKAAAQILPHRRLAASDAAWARWWAHVCATRTEVHATTQQALAAHATFSLWMGHRYARDPRWGWLQEFSGAPPDSLDFRAMDVDLDDLLEVAMLTMELTAGQGFDAHRATMQRVGELGARLAAGERPVWTPAIGERAMAWVQPELHGQLEPAATGRIITGIEALAADLPDPAGLCLPLVVVAWVFGTEAWTDPALPGLCCTRAELQSMTAAQLGQRMVAQAQISTDTPTTGATT